MKWKCKTVNRLHHHFTDQSPKNHPKAISLFTNSGAARAGPMKTAFASLIASHVSQTNGVRFVVDWFWWFASGTNDHLK